MSPQQYQINSGRAERHVREGPQIVGYSKRAGTWIPEDTQSGELTGNGLSKQNQRDSQEAADWATSTWPKSNGLTANQIKTLDGSNTVDTDSLNAIGAPVSLEREEPRGFSSGVYKPRGPFIDGDNSERTN